MKVRSAIVYLLVLFLTACTSSGGGRDLDVNETGDNGLLTPRAIFARYVNALGGEVMIRSHVSTAMTGSFSIPAFGVNGDMVMYTAAPDLMMQRIELGGFGIAATGFDGTVGWSIDPLQGNSILSGDALTSLQERVDYYLPLSLAAASATARALAVEVVAEEEAYKISIPNAIGDETTMYFATDSGLLLQTQAVSPTPTGRIPVVQTFLEYRDFEGLMLPTQIDISQSGQEIRIKVDKVTFDDVDHSVFVLPPEIQALLP